MCSSQKPIKRWVIHPHFTKCTQASPKAGGLPPGDLLDPEAVRTDHLSWVPLMGILHLASPLSAFQATEELIIQEQMSSLAYVFKDCLLFSTFYFPQTVDRGALEGFCSDHAHWTFGKHISFCIFTQKFRVMVLTLILSPVFSTHLAVFEGGGETWCVCVRARAHIWSWWGMQVKI